MQEQANSGSRICVHCGEPYRPRRRNQIKYCSPECKNRAHSKQQRERGRPECSIVVDGVKCTRHSKHPALKVPICSMHDARKRKTGSVGESGTVYGTRIGQWPCEVEGCPRKYYAKGKCSLHYNRDRLTGDVGTADVVRRPAGQGCYSTRDGYRVVVFQAGGRTKRIMEHRLVMEQILNRKLQPFEHVHHKNGVKDDNRPENLELWMKPHPTGQRPEDLVAWVNKHYHQLVVAELVDV